jgi:lysophospholipase L1-like esterase
VIVLLAGTNDLTDPTLAGDDPVAGVTRRIQDILNVIGSKAPEAATVVMGIFPRNDDSKLLPIIGRINTKLSGLADGATIRYLNINDRLANRDGRLFDGMMNSDELHPAVKAYQVWADALKPLLTELLGPPANEDSAPPPTGDPAARR